MELMPIVHNTINNNNQDENSEITNIQINTNNFSTRILYIYKCVDVTYLALLHTFLLSVFETIFYWSYVTIQEKEALLRRLDSFKFIFDLICNNINNEDLKSQIGDYIEQQDDEKEVNNETPLRISIVLIIVLLFLSYVCNLIKMLVRNLIDKYEIEYKKESIGILSLSKTFALSIWYSIPLFIFISLYEYLFFQMVIYYYQPISTYELISTIAESCID